MKDSITIYDIAKIAGVSVATVSRVLNNNTRVAENTKEKITKIIEQYNYKPNGVARSLYRKETKLIGSVLPDITNPYYSMFIFEAERNALELGYTMIISNTYGDGKNAYQAIQTMAERQVDGIIYMGGEKTSPPSLQEVVQNCSERIPFVLVNWDMGETNCYRVCSDEMKGFQLAINEVIRKKYRKVALIKGLEKSTENPKILQYKQAVQQGYFEKEIIIETQYTLNEGRDAMFQLLDLPEPPEAVIAINDQLAIGAINGCYQRGLRVPEDIAIIGYDNIPYSEYFCPGITTVAHDYKNIAKQAVSLLTDKSIQQIGRKNYEYPMKLIRRDSL